MRFDLPIDIRDEILHISSDDCLALAIRVPDTNTYLNAGAEGAGAEAEDAFTRTEVEREIFALTIDEEMRDLDDADAMLETPRHRGEERRDTGRAALRETEKALLEARC